MFRLCAHKPNIVNQGSQFSFSFLVENTNLPNRSDAQSQFMEVCLLTNALAADWII